MEAVPVNPENQPVTSPALADERDPVLTNGPANDEAQARAAVASARRTLDAASTGLSELADSLNGDFSDAVARILALPGRLVVTGMGKSGHVAAKMAATFASTGTPASFVHPGEASHGDLGMITRNDAVLALSNSGNTAELSDIIAYCRRFDIPLIAMTRKGASVLARQADIALVLPASAEACPNGLAPTTSTTQMLALGDALAIALLEARGFTAHDFAVFHPGGALGKRLMTVRDLMHGGHALPLCTPDMTMDQVILEMTGKGFGCVGVTDDTGRLCGIITDGDLRRHMGPDLMGARAGAIMTASPRTIRPGALAAEAMGQMNGTAGDGQAKPVTTLFVVDPQGDGRPEGLIHIHDCLRAGV